MSAIGSISRQLVTQLLTGSGNINMDTDQVLCDATSGAITATLYASPGDGALHQVVVEKTDAGANAVTVTDGTFSFSLANQYETVICQLTAAGAWFGVSGFDRSGTGNVDGPASATSNDIVTFNGTTGKIIKDSGIAATTISTNASIAASATLSGVSAAESIAASATLSGVSAAESIAASAVLSGVSGTASVATSQNASQSLNVSSAMSLAAS